MQTATVDVDAILERDNQLVGAKALPGKRVALRYHDGGEYELDFNPIIAEGGAFAALADPNVFAGAHVAYGGIALAFPGEIDFDAGGLRLDAELQLRGLTRGDVGE
jgi:hypothetical protein